MARLIAISYAGVTIGLGGNASIKLTGKYRWSQTYDEAGITFEALVRNATRVTFLAAEAALLAAFRTPDGDLSVQLGGSSRHVFTQAANTGVNARAAARKVGSDEDTANSALYECSVTVKLPADQSGKAGRKNASEELTYTPSGRRMLKISGTYTALTTPTSATAQYVAAADTYCAAVISDLSLTGLVEKRDENWVRDDNNKTLSFFRTYEEIVHQQGAGDTDVAAIKGAKLIIARSEVSADASPEYGGAQPLTSLVAEYDTWVDKTVTTDLADLWESTVRPAILAYATTLAGAEPVVVREIPRFDATDNRISATVEMLAAASGIVFARVEYEDDVQSGKIFVPVWNGDPYARDQYQGPASHVRRMSTLLVMLRGNKAQSPVPPDGSGFLPSGGTFHEVRALRRVNHLNRGLIGGGQLGLVAVTLDQVFVRAELGSGSSPTGSPDGSRVRDVDPDADLGA